MRQITALGDDDEGGSVQASTKNEENNTRAERRLSKAPRHGEKSSTKNIIDEIEEGWEDICLWLSLLDEKVVIFGCSCGLTSWQ